MSSSEVPVKLNCGKCGSDKLSLPDNPTDDSPVTCESCGIVVGRWGDIKAAAQNTVLEKVKESFKDMLRDAFKGSDNVRIE